MKQVQKKISTSIDQLLGEPSRPLPDRAPRCTASVYGYPADHLPDPEAWLRADPLLPDLGYHLLNSDHGGSWKWLGTRPRPRRTRRRQRAEYRQGPTGLAWLAASGRLGYDLTARAWFHRELPVDVTKVLRRNPRLVSAQRLVDQNKVAQAEPGTWHVAGSGQATYRIRSAEREGTGSDSLESSRPTLVCECPWEEKHHGTRGPCKHVLAVALTLRE